MDEALAAAQAPAAEPLPLLVRDIARDLGITSNDACQALKGLGNFSVNSAVTADMARKLRESFPESIAAPAAVAVPDAKRALQWCAGALQAIGNEHDTVRIAEFGETLTVGQVLDKANAALAATPALPATEDSSAGDPADVVHASTYVQPVPDHCDRIVWRGQYIHLPIAQAEVQAEPGRLGDNMQVRCRKCGEQAAVEYNSARIVTHNPHTGRPRDERDIASDPLGKLIVRPGAALAAAPLAEVQTEPVASTEPVQVIDGGWYWVRYYGLSGLIEAPAQYNKAAQAFYSVSFSGIPHREVEVMSGISSRATAPQAQPADAPIAYLQEADQHLLRRFIKTVEDDDSFDIGKDAVKRLANLGVVENCGFGRYGVTMFGYWVHEHFWHQNPSLPLKTYADRDLERRAAMAAAQGGGAQ
ncbi:hypothetical protein [Comamonas odontotermitis]|uniref:hypothetical protein n=1 Tax=Comamonas odontotermitis TaxID=379895 RepID=UPI00374FFA74